MAAEVKILVKGFTNANSITEIENERTQPTIVLVKDGDLLMVIDPGIMEDQQILVDALLKENLTIDDINIVCITHSHLDHYRNVGMFPKAKVLEFFGIWEKNAIKHWDEQFSTNIKILRTPGHDYTDITIFVTTEDGTVAICGDLFWKENYPADPKDDPFASDHEKLKESRHIVLRMADWIIPGHGAMYKNKRSTLLYEYENEVPKKKIKEKPVCKKCGTEMEQHDRCLCRPYLCFRCCECGFDCPACGCSHKK